MVGSKHGPDIPLLQQRSSSKEKGGFMVSSFHSFHIISWPRDRIGGSCKVDLLPSSRAGGGRGVASAAAAIAGPDSGP